MDNHESSEETWFEKGQIRTVVFHFINIFVMAGLISLWGYLLTIVQAQL